MRRRRAQPALLGDDLVHEHVGVQAALHQALRLAVADQAHRGGRGFLLGCDIDGRETADVEAGFLGQRHGSAWRARPEPAR